MNGVTIRPFSIRTTNTGFGCSSLVGIVSPKEALALVDAAYDSGIRHFDVARSYGQGAAESILGRALRSRRDVVTITSKFGLPVPPQRLVVNLAQTLLRPIARHMGQLRRSGSLPTAGMTIRNVDFSRRNAELSLETTLRELKTDYLDILLLHEASVETLTDPELITFLEGARAAGKIKGYGVGSDLSKIEDLIADRGIYCPLIQLQWSPLTREIPIPPDSFRITHGSLARDFQQLRTAFRSDASLTKLANAVVGVDLSVEEQLSAILLRSAVVRYPGSMTLFSARSTKRIQQNAAALSGCELDSSCAAFMTFISGHSERLRQAGVVTRL